MTRNKFDEPHGNLVGVHLCKRKGLDPTGEMVVNHQDIAVSIQRSGKRAENIHRHQFKGSFGDDWRHESNLIGRFSTLHCAVSARSYVLLYIMVAIRPPESFGNTSVGLGDTQMTSEWFIMATRYHMA